VIYEADDLLASIGEHAASLGSSLRDVLQEKAHELEIRVFLLSRPNEVLKEASWPAYVKRALGFTPSAEFLEALRVDRRGPQLEDGEYLALEERQRGRCALCGRLLVTSASPNVDHRVPVALGGKSCFENFQLLCQKCNLGKSKLVGWIMGAPFFRESVGEPSLGLRYCVLARYQGQCTIDGCGASAVDSEIQVVPRIPVQHGGRIIFDNLTLYCAPHAERSRLDLVRGAIAKAHAPKTSSFTFQRRFNAGS